jgi:hypothetical protein
MSCLCDYFYYYDHCIDPTIQLWWKKNMPCRETKWCGCV